VDPLFGIFSFLQNVKEVVKIVPEVIKSNSKTLKLLKRKSLEKKFRICIKNINKNIK